MGPAVTRSSLPKSQTGAPRHRTCSFSPAQHTQLQPCLVRALCHPAAGPGRRGLTCASRAWGRQETSLLSGSRHQLSHFSPSHSLPIDFSCLTLQLFPISFLCSLVMASSFNSLLFHVFHHFSGSFEPSFASGHSRKAAVPLWHGALRGDTLSEVLPRSCTNSHYHNRLKKTFKQPSDASGKPAG